MANTLGKEHGKLDMSVYSTGRWVECAVDKCYDRNTLIIHRGTLGYKPLFICEDCIGDMVEEYVRFAGKERAKKVLAAALDLLRMMRFPRPRQMRTHRWRKPPESALSLRKKHERYSSIDCCDAVDGFASGDYRHYLSGNCKGAADDSRYPSFRQCKAPGGAQNRAKQHKERAFPIQG